MKANLALFSCIILLHWQSSAMLSEAPSPSLEQENASINYTRGTAPIIVNDQDTNPDENTNCCCFILKRCLQICLFDILANGHVTPFANRRYQRRLY